MKKIYICHEYGGIYDNAKIVVNYIKKLVSYNRNNIYISPILLFGMLYDIVPYDMSMEYCLQVLKDCDSMIIFGDESKSKGCIIEKEFCEKNNIPIIEFTDYCKRFMG